MKYSTGPWRWENTAGAGLQIFAHVRKTNCVEFTLREGEFPVYGLTDHPSQNTHTGECLLAYEQFIQFSPEEWTEMQTANARLMAAAPDLLEACEAVLSNRACLPMRQIMQAIEKATGKQVGWEQVDF